MLQALSRHAIYKKYISFFQKLYVLNALVLKYLTTGTRISTEVGCTVIASKYLKKVTFLHLCVFAVSIFRVRLRKSRLLLNISWQKTINERQILPCVTYTISRSCKERNTYSISIQFPHCTLKEDIPRFLYGQGFLFVILGSG